METRTIICSSSESFFLKIAVESVPLAEVPIFIQVFSLYQEWMNIKTMLKDEVEQRNIIRTLDSLMMRNQNVINRITKLLQEYKFKEIEEVYKSILIYILFDGHCAIQIYKSQILEVAPQIPMIPTVDNIEYYNQENDKNIFLDNYKKTNPKETQEYIEALDKKRLIEISAELSVIYQACKDLYASCLQNNMATIPDILQDVIQVLKFCLKKAKNQIIQEAFLSDPNKNKINELLDFALQIYITSTDVLKQVESSDCLYEELLPLRDIFDEYIKNKMLDLNDEKSRLIQKINAEKRTNKTLPLFLKIEITKELNKDEIPIFIQTLSLYKQWVSLEGRYDDLKRNKQVTLKDIELFVDDYVLLLKRLMTMLSKKFNDYEMKYEKILFYILMVAKTKINNCRDETMSLLIIQNPSVAKITLEKWDVDNKNENEFLALYEKNNEALYTECVAAVKNKDDFIISIDASILYKAANEYYLERVRRYSKEEQTVIVEDVIVALKVCLDLVKECVLEERKKPSENQKDMSSHLKFMLQLYLDTKKLFLLSNKPNIFYQDILSVREIINESIKNKKLDLSLEQNMLVGDINCEDLSFLCGASSIIRQPENDEQEPYFRDQLTPVNKQDQLTNSCARKLDKLFASNSSNPTIRKIKPKKKKDSGTIPLVPQLTEAEIKLAEERRLQAEEALLKKTHKKKNKNKPENGKKETKHKETAHNASASSEPKGIIESSESSNKNNQEKFNLLCNKIQACSGQKNIAIEKKIETIADLLEKAKEAVSDFSGDFLNAANKRIADFYAKLDEIKKKADHERALLVKKQIEQQQKEEVEARRKEEQKLAQVELKRLDERKKKLEAQRLAEKNKKIAEAKRSKMSLSVKLKEFECRQIMISEEYKNNLLDFKKRISPYTFGVGSAPFIFLLDANHLLKDCDYFMLGDDQTEQLLLKDGFKKSKYITKVNVYTRHRFGMPTEEIVLAKVSLNKERQLTNLEEALDIIRLNRQGVDYSIASFLLDIDEQTGQTTIIPDLSVSPPNFSINNN